MMNPKNIKPAVPKYRFKGTYDKNGNWIAFTDPWEQRKLEDMCTIITKQTGFDYSATIKPSLVTTKEDDTYSFIQNKDFEGMNINLDTDFYIPISVAEKYPKITLDQPSLLISISGRIGNIGLYSLDSKAFIGGAVGICKLKDIEDGKTTLYELLSPAGQKYFNSLIKASSHANITVEDIRNIEVLLPKHDEEKKRINIYFENLDHLIALCERKCESYRKAKQAMMQKLFSQEVRFTADDGSEFPEWEEKMLGNILTEKNIQHSKSKEFPLVSFTVEKGVTDKTDRYNREQLVIGDKSTKKYKETKLNDIVYNPANLKFGAIARNKYGNAVFSPIYVTFEVNDQYNPIFIEYTVVRKSFIQTALSYQQGTVYERMSVNANDLCSIYVFIPSSLEEQTKIANCLSKYDDLIAATENKLAAYKQLKKCMLQNMFV